ncbi:MAG: hypothetical protein R3F11_21980 [Verrucomicrobiales bacterium]
MSNAFIHIKVGNNAALPRQQIRSAPGAQCRRGGASADRRPGSPRHLRRSRLDRRHAYGTIENATNATNSVPTRKTSSPPIRNYTSQIRQPLAVPAQVR